MKRFALKQILSGKDDRKAKAQRHGHPEEADQSQPLTRTAYNQARRRAFIYCLELDDWLGVESDMQKFRGTAS